MNKTFEEQKLASIITYTKKIEILLKENGATGKGIHSHVSSIESKLNSSLIKDLRWIATMRNKSIHEDFIIDNIESFEKTCKRVITKINNISKLEKNPSSNAPKIINKDKRIFYIFIIIIIAFFYLYGGDTKEVIQNKIKKIDVKIEKLNDSITSNENKILNKKNNLDSEVKSQGLLHSIFIDTDIVNKLELELESLENISSELKDEKKEILEEKQDLIGNLN